ncbi:hypothetical protein DL93DRAFT_362455 [Clavulina sp. PMI_390]|nr:hypothetical protein DL93DRAFT_362455 [Clavulina sp. PMI_390]
MPGQAKACLQCRKHKIKCDGLKPECSSCSRSYRECGYPSLDRRVNRRGGIDILLKRVLELEKLETSIRHSDLSSAHDLSLASIRLLERIGRLGNVPHPRQPPIPARNPVQVAAEQELCSIDPADLEQLEELPLSLSMNLIALFLPHRANYYLMVDKSYFMDRISLPPSHPDSIHPCLLNACYLAACASVRGGLERFKSCFLQRTRRFLQRSLMFVDRTTHFLWASLVLGVFYARERRLIECLAWAGSTAHFAIACGLDLPREPALGDKDLDSSRYILPPAKDENEADDRSRLAQAIYVGAQGFPILCECPPILPYDDNWLPASKRKSPTSSHSQKSIAMEELWRESVHLRVLISNTVHQVMGFARSAANKGHVGLEKEYLAMEARIHTLQARLHSLPGSQTIPHPNSSPSFDPNLALAHIMLCGSGIILHGFWAIYHPESRGKMLECLQMLINICKNVPKGKRHHISLVGITQIMSAIRVIARELQRSSAKENHRLSIKYCYSMEFLLDFLDEQISCSPAWGERCLFPYAKYIHVTLADVHLAPCLRDGCPQLIHLRC